jgi:hypothetical protein
MHNSLSICYFTMLFQLNLLYTPNGRMAINDESEKTRKKLDITYFKVLS